MKILLSNAVVSHGAFHHWMTADLVALGHEVSMIDADELCEQFGIELYRRVLLQRIAADKPDIFLCYPPYDLLRPQERAAIHASGTAIVGFAYDDPIFLPSYTQHPGDFEKIAAEFRETYDLHFTTSRDMVKQANDRNIHHIQHIRWACVTPAEPGDGVRDLPLVIIGAPYPRRVKMVKHLKQAGLKPVVFGAENWKQFLDVADCYSGMLTRPGMFEMYRRAKIALAPADWESNYTPMVKLRSLEIASMGPLQIMEQCEDVLDYFEDGKEVVTYRAHDWDQLVELIKQYLNDEPNRAKIARAGHERLLRDHVWKVRWAEIESAAKPILEKIRRKPAIEVNTPAEKAGAATAQVISVAKGAYDAHLAQELGLAACAMHYEKLGDVNTALVAVNEWLAVQPNYYANLLIKGRVLFHQKNFAESETCFLRALEAGKGLCGLGVDITCTQRKLGPRLGLGRMFSGIFPRHLECNSHLLMIYAFTDQQEKAEALMTSLAAIEDHLFVSIVAIIADGGGNGMTEGALPPKYLARYIEVILSLTPTVWAGEQKRHRAHFWMLRGYALATLGNRVEGRECLLYALSQDPYPQVEQQIRKHLAIV